MSSNKDRHSLSCDCILTYSRGDDLGPSLITLTTLDTTLAFTLYSQNPSIAKPLPCPALPLSLPTLPAHQIALTVQAILTSHLAAWHEPGCHIGRCLLTTSTIPTWTSTTSPILAACLQRWLDEEKVNGTETVCWFVSGPGLFAFRFCFCSIGCVEIHVIIPISMRLV